MRATRIPADEQFRLIMECRASGLTDHEWCMQNGTRPGTFYNWVKRLRKNGCTDIPKSAGGHAHGRQEVVRIELAPPEPDGQTLTEPRNVISPATDNAMQLSISGAVLQIPNGTDPILLRQTIHILRELPC